MTMLAVYKVLHILGILLVFIGLGGLLMASRAGGPATQDRKLAGMLHGLGLVIILVSGFGALARIGMSNPGIWPAWLWIKALVWLALGASLVLIRRMPRLATLWWVLLPLLGTLAAYLAFRNPA